MQIINPGFVDIFQPIQAPTLSDDWRKIIRDQLKNELVLVHLGLVSKSGQPKIPEIEQISELLNQRNRPGAKNSALDAQIAEIELEAEKDFGMMLDRAQASFEASRR